MHRGPDYTDPRGTPYPCGYLGEGASEVAVEYGGVTDGVQYDHPPSAHGFVLPRNVQHGSFASPSMRCAVGYNVLLPPDYDTSPDRSYPPVYYLHGRGDDENYLFLPSEASVCEVLLSAMEEQRVTPCVFVMAHAGRHAGYVDAANGSVMGETMLVDELIPHIDATFRTIPTQRCLQGWSMGGQGVLVLAFKHPTLFSSVVAMAPGLCTGDELVVELPAVFATMFSSVQQHDETSAWAWAERNAEAIKASGLGISIIHGKKDPQLYRSQRMHAVLGQWGIEHSYLEVDGVGHESGKMYTVFSVSGMWFHAHHQLKKDEKEAQLQQRPKL